MIYRLARPLLFTLSPSRAHRLATSALRILSAARGHRPRAESVVAPLTILGLRFPNIVGLAAGFDKSGQHVDDLAQLGFGFIEVGTITPRAQRGNPSPNLFRLVKDRALINRDGFSNDGVQTVVRRLERRRFAGVCGVNIGKNLSTPIEHAAQDYVVCLRAVYPTADYVTVNVSSPNTPGLRDLQVEALLRRLLAELVDARESLIAIHRKRVPLLIKISPDLDDLGLHTICDVLLQSGIDGVIATNTTITRPTSLRSRLANETGGLSGAPLHGLSVTVIRRLRAALGSAFPIVGVGGISDTQTARETIAAGANLIQLYSGLIYEGPGLVRRLVRDVRPSERVGR